jgi:SAM-dependent methyltransferase
MFYMYDPIAEHWQKCEAQLKALFRLESWDAEASHDTIGHPYVNLESAALPQRANAGMFNVCLDMIGEKLYGSEFIYVGGAFRGWSAFYFSDYAPVLAVDISDHRCFGMGTVPTDNGYGIWKIIADCCMLPLADESVDIAFMCATFHHLHDKTKGLNEAHRVLKPGGCFVAMGDRPTNEEDMDSRLADGIRDYEGLPYTESDVHGWFDASDFSDIGMYYFNYSDHMEDLGFFSLIKPDGANAIIYGVKN